MTLALVSPLKGWASPLAELPDPAFAQGLVGDGVAIDPTGDTLHSPCAGVVVGIHRTLHAVTLRADNGADILCHIGIETVGLGGKGFAALVAEGDRVAAGAPLIRFDLETLARTAKSLASPILVVDTNAFRIGRRAADTRVAVGDWLMDVEPLGVSAPAATTTVTAGPARTRVVTLPAGHGIHARPAAAIVNCAHRFAAEVEFVTVRARAPATSAVALMTLGLAAGDSVTLHAAGADADSALAALAQLIETGLAGESQASAGPGSQDDAVGPQRASESERGVTAVPGFAIGTIFHLHAVHRDTPELGQGSATERLSLEAALAQVRAVLNRRATTGSPAQREIGRAHLTLLDDPRLRGAAENAIARGASAGAAWRAALAPDIAALRAVADGRIAGRADDMIDLEQQVIAATLGVFGQAPELPDEAIVVAHDLLPSQLMALDPGRLAGVALVAGGPTSHVAIIAASAGLPMVVALGPAALALPGGARAMLDADAATLTLATPAGEQAARVQVATIRAMRSEARAAADKPCHLADGSRIEIFANLGSLADADAAMAAGAEGCGLLRTELLFMDRAKPPDEAEQYALYAAIAARLDGRPLIIRTLDIGGDKPVPYLPIAPEDNPALGLRGIRVGLAHPDLLDTQLRAILRVSPPGQCRILVPMVASVAELVEVRRRAELAARAIGHDTPLTIGVMIETPAAAVTADLLAPVADFFAIGTNDLAQYTLAMDRGNPSVARQVDALHPAVLRMIDCTVRAAAASSRPVGVCGGLASDLPAAPILVGLGVTELSAVPGIIPELKARLRGWTFAQCAGLAAEALALPSAGAVRALAARGLR